MKRIFLKGETAHCTKTIALRPSRVIARRGHRYRVRGTKAGCCDQLLDIGYHHGVPLRVTCSECGKASTQHAPVYVPARYFRVVPASDVLFRGLAEIERGMVLLDLDR